VIVNQSAARPKLPHVRRPYSKCGKPGTPIPNSSMFRGYCRECGDPIRVTRSNLCHSECCFNCDLHIRPQAKAIPDTEPDQRIGRSQP